MQRFEKKKNENKTKIIFSKFKHEKGNWYFYSAD